jgi:adenosylhomocysteine nucleosidase
MTNPLIVMALETEAQGHFDTLPTVFTGIGKVNAAYQLLKAIHTHKPTHVVNLGSAGSSSFPSGSLVNCIRFIQRDMDARALGFEHYVTPFGAETSPILTYGTRGGHLAEGVCGTGDSFYIGGKTEEFNVIDMEAYALAKICQHENIPFSCIKFITDGADGQAASDWSAMLSLAALNLRKCYDELAL